MTYGEKVLWSELRKLPLHVRKQSPVGNYIVDFMIHSRKLIIEVDGEIHELRQEHDVAREAYLRGEGFRVLRFSNAEVVADVAAVIARITALLGLPEGEVR